MLGDGLPNPLTDAMLSPIPQRSGYECARGGKGGCDAAVCVASWEGALEALGQVPGGGTRPPTNCTLGRGASQVQPGAS